MTPYHEQGGITIYHGDCLEVMRGLPDGCADLIVADPPYYRVKDSWWDNQWKTPAAFLEWLGLVVDELARLMKPNGSLYLFASPQMAARVELMIEKRLCVLNHITWYKFARGISNRSDKEGFRQFFPESERIVFAEHYGSDGHAMNGAGYDQKCDELRGFVFEPLRAWMREQWKSAGLSAKDLNLCVGSSPSGGGMASHYIGNTGQWELPTERHYESIRERARSINPSLFAREYEDLRTQYEDLRRPFNMTAQKQFTDVWEFMPVLPYPGKHECEKPPAMLHHIIDVSSRPGAVVLDPFLGSGRSLDVAKGMGRQGIGIEVQEMWCRRASERLSQLHLFNEAA